MTDHNSELQITHVLLDCVALLESTLRNDRISRHREREALRGQIAATVRDVRAILATRKAAPEPDAPRTYWACPECGCTDVQVQAWVHANTDAVLDSCDSYNWCPQCEADGEGGEIRSLKQTTEPKPYAEPEA